MQNIKIIDSKTFVLSNKIITLNKATSSNGYNLIYALKAIINSKKIKGIAQFNCDYNLLNKTNNQTLNFTVKNI